MVKSSPGALRYRIQIERETLTSDGIGGQTVNVAIVDTVWAAVESASAREVERFDKLNTEQMNKFIIRQREDLLQTDRIIHRGVRFNIRSIDNTGPYPLYLQIMAEKGVAQ